MAFKSGPYGELIKHPSPICLLNLPLLLMSLVPATDGGKYLKFLEKMNDLFSKMMFWLENIVWILGFLAYELLLVPFVYLSNFYNIIWATNGPFLPIFYTMFWLIGGIPFSLFIVLRDVWLFITLLSVLEGCRRRTGKEDTAKLNPSPEKVAEDLQREIDIYEEVRGTVIDMYYDALKQIKLKNGEGEDQKGDEEGNQDERDDDILKVFISNS